MIHELKGGRDTAEDLMHISLGNFHLGFQLKAQTAHISLRNEKVHAMVFDS